MQLEKQISPRKYSYKNIVPIPYFCFKFNYGKQVLPWKDPVLSRMEVISSFISSYYATKSAATKHDII